MAEVRKKIVEDKYGTAKISKKNVKKTKSKGVEVNEKIDKKNSKGIFDGILIFFNGVKSEFKKVHWTSKKDMIKYSIACIFFIVFCSLFFYLIEVIFALVQSLLA